MLGTVYFKDGHTEQLRYIDIMNNPKEKYMVFSTPESEYCCVSGEKIEDYDEQTNTWSKVPFVHFYKFDREKDSWERTEDIEKVSIKPSTEVVYER